LAAGALSCRSLNTAEWQAVLPCQACDDKSKERYSSRLLGNRLMEPWAVMRGFLPELAARAGADGKTVVLMIDQSKVRDGFECLMISLRTGERAIPVAWRVLPVKGNIGCNEQELWLAP
jgi:hypothetical protein